MVYLGVKAFHIMAIISWMAGIFYLPRLFVYHADSPIGSDKSEIFKIMERRLLKAIMVPAMIAAWISGIWIAYDMEMLFDTWFILKFLLVIGMTIYHFTLASWVKAFAGDSNSHPSKFYRVINEIPTLLMIFIVILVIFKPF